MRAQFLTLESCVEQAGRAMGCVHSGSQDFEAAVISARRGTGLFGSGLLTQVQIVLAATAFAATAMLVALFA